MFCKNCGNGLGDDVKFCPKCGTEVVLELESDASDGGLAVVPDSPAPAVEPVAGSTDDIKPDAKQAAQVFKDLQKRFKALSARTQKIIIAAFSAVVLIAAIIGIRAAVKDAELKAWRAEYASHQKTKDFIGDAGGHVWVHYDDRFVTDGVAAKFGQEESDFVDIEVSRILNKFGDTYSIDVGLLTGSTQDYDVVELYQIRAQYLSEYIFGGARVEINLKENGVTKRTVAGQAR
jgi:hypothetical protein